MKLLIDLGNTRLKWGTGTLPETIKTGEPVNNYSLSTSSLISLWQSLSKPYLVAIASVSSNELLTHVSQAVNTLWPGITVYRAKSQRTAHGVTSAYKQPDKIGVDRWLGMVAAYHKTHKAFCLASCGTAITIDIVDSSGRHQGGLIAPGIKLMQQALVNGTENLDQIGGIYPDGMASNTEAAIYNGTLFAVCGLIERVLSMQSSTLDLILTGGDARIIADKLLIPAAVEPDLVLSGLALTSPEE